jgi:hypothetical protein
MTLIIRKIVYLSLLLFFGCQTTQLETTWKDPNAGPIAFKKVAVLVLNSTPAERRAQEDEIVSLIKGTQAVASYTFVPDAERSRDQVVKLIRDQECDGAIVLRLTSSDQVKTYVPGQENYFLSSTDYSWETPRTDPGYYTTDTFVRAEVSIYSVADGKLLWSGASNTQNPANAKDLAMQVARASTAELRKQGLLR